MMGLLWVVLFVALTGSHLGYGLPVRPTPQAYPHDASTANAYEGWGAESAYAAVPALALVLTAVGLLFGCTWCYRHKDCKPNEGADNQLFTATAAHLHEARRAQPPDSGFSEPANNNISEDNNNGPISLREMQNIANNNAAAYIVSDNEERNRVSRESVVEFEPLPTGIRVADPLEHCADWFGGEDFSRNRLQYLREIGRGWFGRVVEGEIDDAGTTSPVAVKILNQNASLEDKARFLDEAKMYRDVRHENILAFVAKCLQEDPWILIFEFCSMDLQQYLVVNRPKMAILNESGVPLRLMCDVTGALAYLHSRGYLYGNVWSGGVLVRGAAENARGVLGSYAVQEQNDAAEARAHGAHTSTSTSSSAEMWCVGTLVWEVCAWGAAAPAAPPADHAAAPAAPHPPPPDLPCPYRSHLYQVMQLCWHPQPECRPTSAQVHALINHLYTTHTDASDVSQDDGYGSTDFEERWQRLKPNTIPKLDEHVAIVHAPSTSMASHFTGSDQEFDNAPTISHCQDTLSVDMDTAVSRSSSIMSDKDPLSVQIKSESLTNLHGSLEDVRNIYLTHNEMAVLECHQGNISLEDSREKEQDRSDSSMDPWLKDIIADSHDDVSYYKDVSDVIKNLDNILNSEKTSSSESSHQASPSRDNLSLDCKKDYQMPSCMVKSPGINNFQNLLVSGFATKSEDDVCEDEDTDRDTIGTLSHSFERHSDTVSQHTLENLTPDTPNKDIDTVYNNEGSVGLPKSLEEKIELDKESAKSVQHDKLPKGIDIVNSDSEIPKLRELCVSSINSVSETSIEQLNVIKDCQTPCDNNFTEIRTDIKEETKSIDDIGKPNVDSGPLEDVGKPNVDSDPPEDVGKIDNVRKLEKEERTIVEEVILPESDNEITGNNLVEALPNIETALSVTKVNEIPDIKPEVKLEDISLPPKLIESSIKYINEPLMNNILIEMPNNSSDKAADEVTYQVTFAEEKQDVERKGEEGTDIKNISASQKTPDSVQNIIDSKESHDTNNILEEKEITMVVSSEENTLQQLLTPDKVQNEIENTINPEIEEANDFKENLNIIENNTLNRSESEELIDTKNHLHSTNSTVYMHLLSNTNSEIFNQAILDNSVMALEDNTIDSNIKRVIQSCLESASTESDCGIVNNESTIYLDLPSFVVRKETDNFLHMEKIISGSHTPDNIFASTPKGSDSSCENQYELTLENSAQDNETQFLSVIDNSFEDKKTQALSEFDNSGDWNKTQVQSEIGPSLKSNETKVLSEIDDSTTINETQESEMYDISAKGNVTQVLSGVQRSVEDNETIVLSEIENSIKDDKTQVLSEIKKSVIDKETRVLPEIENSSKVNETHILLNIENAGKDNKVQLLPQLETSVKNNETQILIDNSVKVNESQVLSEIENSIKENETQILSIENSVKDSETQVLPEHEELETSVKENESQVLPDLETSFKNNETQILIENSVKVNESQVLSEIENSIKENEPQILSIENSVKENETQVLPEHEELETSVKENESQVLPDLETSFKNNETQILIENSVKVNESQVLSEIENSIKENETQILSIENSVKENETQVLPEHENFKQEESHILLGIEELVNDYELKDLSEIENETQILSIENSVNDDGTQVFPEPENFKQEESHVLLGIEELVNNYELNDLSGIENSAKENETQVLLDIKNSVKEHESQVLSGIEKCVKENEVQVLSEPKVPDYGPGVSVTKLEQRHVPDSLSPFESPTKSHHTDTYDENSSVVLGPFENCTLDLFKGVKSSIDNIDIPKEEMLAFSSNFSDINLATPSPLRDGNFLNEVPDIFHDDFQFDDIEVISEVKTEPSEPISDDTDQSATEKHVSPSTPPNSPGIFPASTSQQKYLVDIDLNHEPTHQGPDFNLQKEIELNHIELQITSKLAMAENENNLNIEYSGPLTVEGLLEEGVLMRESDAIPESYLAGNGGSLEELREELTLDEECVKALRNELELKLPLAQVATIEPPLELEGDGDTEWKAPDARAPAPPELVVSYPPALSPIAEETGQQLSAYENDINWNTSARTESSESYPEPCNNSTDDVTELPTAAQDQSTYTLHSKEHSLHNNTYTVQKDIMSSKEITMSADSLNASPFRKPIIDPLSPVDDTTYNINDDEKDSNCERISQVSPFLLSPTTDTSVPDNSDNFDNATGVSTLSKTTLPTDAKLSKPSETQCLSKATSIDSWCSNDTLYNVEENFDDLVLDPEVPIDLDPEKEEGGSESNDTLTHNDDEKELSHCSTYIEHDSKSEVCETFSPDSITANDNYTYTKVKTEAATTPVHINKSAINDSTKTKDLAYGTMTSGLPSFSNCASEIASAVDDIWKLQQPELMRRSPVPDDINITPPKFVENKDILDESSPKLASEPCIKKMDSVEMPCPQDISVEESKNIENDVSSIEVVNSPDNNYMPSVTSTPRIEVPADTDVFEAISMRLPEIKTDSPECSMKVLNFTSFQQSIEIRPQDLSSDISNECTNQDTELLLEGESKMLSSNSNRDSVIMSEHTPTYSDFESSATTKPQDVQSKSSQSLENGVSSEDFRQFENSVRNCPQDLSSIIDASSLLLKSERMSSELAMTSSSISYEPTELELSPPNISNLIESHIISVREPPNMFNFDEEEETEQPHSIIITESSMDAFKESPNKTSDSHAQVKHIDLNTYDSHHESVPNIRKSVVNNIGEKIILGVNGANEQKGHLIDRTENKSPKAGTSNVVKDAPHSINVSETENKNDITNGSLSEDNAEYDDIKCNGSSEKFAIVNFLSETFEELIESNVDDNDTKDAKVNDEQVSPDGILDISSSNDNKTAEDVPLEVKAVTDEDITSNGVTEVEDEKMTLVTEDFLQNEKKFCQIDSYLPLLSDIRFTGPATEIMSTSFTQDSPTEPTSPECEQCEQDSKPNIAAEIAKEWDSDSDSHSSNSSSGEFIWKDGEGHETSVVPSTHFDHQRGNGPQPDGADSGERASDGGVASEGSGDSGSGSEGDEVEFVPSSWDCRAAPSKSSLRSLEAPADNKKRVVFKRQKYHCVYEYPREAADLDIHSPAYLPDLSTYSEWSPSSMEEAELGYGQLFSSAPSALDLFPIPIPAGIAFGADYDEDFFISSSARPFESLGMMSTTSQFFPGMHVKPSLVERDLPDDLVDDFPPPPSPLATTTLVQTRTPSLDFTTPDSGVEDITPVSTIDDDFKAKKLSETELTWRPVDSASSSESVSPSSPGGEALGGLRHTRDKLKLDLPPSPHIPPSPRHNRVFNFVLDKPKRRSQEERPVEVGSTPLVMTDETPIVTTTLPLQKDCEELPAPEPTFSTFGKTVQKPEPEPKAIILTDEIQDAEPEVKDESPKVVEAVKGEGTVLDSGDEDSGIESSSKATLERNKTPNVS